MSSKEWYYFSWQAYFTEFLSWSASIGIIFGGVIPYIPQYFQIKSSGNADGFSLYVCLALLIANILRILFWFGRQFELPLLIQSIVMNVCMLVMIELCVRTKRKLMIIPNKKRMFLAAQNSLDMSDGSSFIHRRFTDFDLQFFWDWTDFTSYLECLAGFTVASGMIMYSALDFPLFVEFIGFAALFTEALLGFPQFYKNYKNKSTLGMNQKMVFMWTIGDLFKTIYFIIRNAPLQFWASGILQVSIDLLILSQIAFYRFNKLTKAII